ncbi:MAG: hypothetical protein QOF53_3463 [Nocardioidaceae bacterium]|nr:hypothetical protein [Nocardioidaceae bacterium]
MSGDPASEASPSEASRSEAERRRRRSEVFGDVLPETTADERGETWDEGRPAGSSASDRGKVDPADEWLRRQVPPHHT